VRKGKSYSFNGMVVNNILLREGRKNIILKDIGSKLLVY